jgi:MFS transporter, DHA1 family, multidrug resistance protein
MYLPFTYPQYAASLLTANDFAGSAFAAGCIVFSGRIFKSLGVAKGCSLLAELSCGCTILFYLLHFYGANLRKRSRFAVTRRVCCWEERQIEQRVWLDVK